MRRCFSLAIKGRPSPNPFVGAVIVRNGRVVGEGFHEAAGQRHAEAEAIRQVKRKFGAMAPYFLSTSTLYVNLEPCDHYGKQPPCTQAILRAGIRRVVYAMPDPNPQARGGAGTLAKNGVNVRLAGAKMQAEARALNAPFIHRIRTGRAYVTLKMALSKDNQVAASGAGRQAAALKSGRTDKPHPIYISSPASLEMAHVMRDKCPAIMAGIGTVRADNPRLTCRMAGGHDPLRIIVDARLQIDEKAKVLRDDRALLACGRKMDRQKAGRLKKRGFSLVILPERGGRLDFRPLLAHLAGMGIDHVLLEGGPRLAESMLRQGLVNETVLFRSPKKMGAGKQDPEMAKAVDAILAASRAARRQTMRSGPDRVEFARARKEKNGCFWPAFFEK
ncbi:2,5-diamino-6-ribosylamino-4(3H)-pyrimidinone 5'-phosphate reductase [uncultured archaeon]|nr:2,5-diamino-6-ribosylamino-4(3H)-pyrimidinone 5'-phosphate reductase [uncultured archaeon]